MTHGDSKGFWHTALETISLNTVYQVNGCWIRKAD